MVKMQQKKNIHKFLQNIQKLSFENKCDENIFKMLNFHMIKAEAAAPDAAKVFIQFLKNEMKSTLKL